MRPIKKVILFSILALLVLSASCNSEAVTGTISSEIDDEAAVKITETTTGSDTPSSQADEAEVLDTETEPEDPVSSWYFPQLKAPSDAYMEALLTGTLELTDGFLRIDGYIIIWQSEYTADNSSGTLEIRDGKGVIIGRVGEIIRIGGGTGAVNNGLLKEPLPPGTKGPFWILGEGIPLDTGKETTVVSPPDQSANETVDEVSLDQIVFAPYDTRSLETILAELPLYPGSVASDYLNENSEPAAESVPLHRPGLTTGSDHFRTVSAEYSVYHGFDTAIIDWYRECFSDISVYKKGEEHVTHTSTNDLKSLMFELLQKPGYFIEVRVFTLGETLDPVIELLVADDLTLSTPFDSGLIPDDLTGVTIEFESYDPVTISDSRVLTGMAGLINRMPVHPPWVVFGPLPPLDADTEPEIRYTLKFTSASQGSTTFSYKVGYFSSATGLYTEDGTNLWDTYSLLTEKIESINRLYNS